MEKQNACALMDQTTNLNVVNAAESIVQVENVLLTRTISPHVFVMMRMLRAHLKVNTPIANAPWIVEKMANVSENSRMGKKYVFATTRKQSFLLVAQNHLAVMRQPVALKLTLLFSEGNAPVLVKILKLCLQTVQSHCVVQQGKLDVLQMETRYVL